jgi:NAD(P)H-dependent flavin oxidoreductase YrpB (nitropropane dioxygenase family)
MRTAICEMFDIDVPIFAFSHCRDVVVEASKAGGFGVLGASGFSPRQLEIELKWIDDHIGGRPYGVDVLIPSSYEKMPRTGKIDVDKFIPRGTREWLDQVLTDHQVPPLPEAEAEAVAREEASRLEIGIEQAETLMDTAFNHPIKLAVSALGPPSRHIVQRAHSLGIKVCGLAGKVNHALRQKEAGVDFIVAQGTEAGGHTGEIASMVLVPQVVDALAPLPVVAAGGIARGRQMAAALALGAEGVWCGSVWLGTSQSELTPEMKRKLYQASSSDTVRARYLTGKPCRMLRSGWSQAWESPGAPQPLMLPLQVALTTGARHRIERFKATDLMTYPVGQVVGQIDEERSVRQVFYDMLAEFADCCQTFSRFAES